MNFKFELLEKETLGTIELNNKVRISDPCYSADEWCAGTLENVLPGKYHCFYQKVDSGDWGVRVASIEVRHENYLEVDPTEVTNIDVGVDSGQAGIYDFDYFAKNREDKYGEDAWYHKICNSTSGYIENPNYAKFKDSHYWKDEFTELEKTVGFFVDVNGIRDLLNVFNKGAGSSFDKLKEMLNSTKDATLNEEYCNAREEYLKSDIRHEYFYDNTPSIVDNKCLVSCSGDGDGSYTCLVGRRYNGQIVSIKVDYYYDHDEYEE